MTRDDDFRIRPGRIRSTPQPRAKSFLNEALRAAQKAGGLKRARSSANSSFGRGRAASLGASRALTSRARRVTIPARVVRHRGGVGSLRAHLNYLQRDGVTRDGERGQMFDAEREGVDAGGFAERCQGDRHHFRFIVSPEDGGELSSLRDFTRDLMVQAERDLGTGLDWVGVEHWNTEHPHVHVLVRGRTDAGQDLVISRDYISGGFADRASAIVTQELGPRTDLDIRRDLGRQVEAERWTRLDRVLARDASANAGVVDLRRDPKGAADEYRTEKLARLRKLERLELAEGDGTGRFTLAADAEPKLRALGERGDIIARLNKAVMRGGREADASAFVLEGESAAPVLGRLAARGLDDELKGSAYAVVEGVDGRTHHVKFADLDAAGDGRVGSIVEVRRYEDARGRERVALTVRSDLTVEAQVTATGATWLDRQAIAREPAALGAGGFGAEVRDALERRAEHLAGEDLARRDGQRVVFSRDLLDTLRGRELADMASRLSAETRLPHRPVAAGEHVAGVYRQRLQLASGRFAMLDDGLGFQLVPWSPSLEKRLGQQVGGVATPGGVDWDFGRKRGLAL